MYYIYTPLDTKFYELECPEWRREATKSKTPISNWPEFVNWYFRVEITPDTTLKDAILASSDVGKSYYDIFLFFYPKRVLECLHTDDVVCIAEGNLLIEKNIEKIYTFSLSRLSSPVIFYTGNECKIISMRGDSELIAPNMEKVERFEVFNSSDVYAPLLSDIEEYGVLNNAQAFISPLVKINKKAWGARPHNKRR